MADSEEFIKQKEVIAMGTLDQFRGLVELEQLATNPTYAGYVHDSGKLPVYLYGPISGTATKTRASIYWLVVTGVNIVLDDLRMGSATGTGGAFGSLWFTPDMSLDEMDHEAQKLEVRLSETIDAGEIRATELPGGRLRILFVLSAFEHPDLFWQWADSFVEEMVRQGFIRTADQKYEDIQRLIYTHKRRLQKLKEQAAIHGTSVDPKVSIEIEDIEKEIAKLQAQIVA